MKRKMNSLFFGMLLSMQAFSQVSPVSPADQPNCDILCNPGFDYSIPPIPTVSLLNNSQLPCWNTTATDGLMEIWANGYNGVPSYSGTQFLEINATQSSTVYQDFTMTPGSVLSIGFAHRGRAGMDSIMVEAGPVGGPYTDLGHFGDGTSGWGYYTVPYTVPPSSGSTYTVRFTSIYWSGGNIAIGNFLDAVSLCRTGTVPTECDVCESTSVKLIDFMLVNAEGDATSTFYINSGGRVISKMRFTLLNFRATPTDPSCKNYCNIGNENFGHFTAVREPVTDFSYTLAPFNPAVTPKYTNQIEMFTGTPRAIDDYVSFGLRFPPIFADGCSQVVEACFRVEFIDKDCVVCDRVVCTSEGRDPKDPTDPKGMGMNQGAERLEDRTLDVYPNPNNGTFRVSTRSIGSNCTYQLTTLEGREVKSGKIEGDLLEISDAGLPQGTYTLFVFRDNQVFIEKIVVVKNH